MLHGEGVKVTPQSSVWCVVAACAGYGTGSDEGLSAVLMHNHAILIRLLLELPRAASFATTRVSRSSMLCHAACLAVGVTQCHVPRPQPADGQRLTIAVQ